jgi:hypothetical protein
MERSDISENKGQKGAGYWFNVFRISQTKENHLKLHRTISLVVIAVMIMSIILLLKKHS